MRQKQQRFLIDHFAVKNNDTEKFWTDRAWRNEVPSEAYFSVRIWTFVPLMKGADHEKTEARLRKIQGAELEWAPGGANGDWQVCSTFSSFEEALEKYPAQRRRIENAIVKAPQKKKGRAS